VLIRVLPSTVVPFVDRNQLIPSRLYMTGFVLMSGFAPATHRDPFQARVLIPLNAKLVPFAEAIHVIPSKLYAIGFRVVDLGFPPATHRDPFQATVTTTPVAVNSVVPFVDGNQLIPSGL
jgi:hypothetical protein